MHEGEEFFIPDNVLTEFRLWFMGPKHLRRMAASPAAALVAGFVAHLAGAPLWGSILAGLVALALYTALYGIPLGLDDEAILDTWVQVHRFSRQQNYFPHPGPEGRGPDERTTESPPTDGERSGLAAASGNPGAVRHPGRRAVGQNAGGGQHQPEPALQDGEPPA